VISLALHAALGVWVQVRAKEKAPDPRPSALPAHDAWSGSGIEVEAAASTGNPAGTTTPAATTQDEASAGTATQARAAAPRAEPSDGLHAAKRASPRRTAPKTAAAAVAPAEAASGAATSTGSSEGAAPALFGASGLPPGVRHLPRAFARAVALANRGDTAWRTLPPGVVGEASVALPVEHDGALGTLAFADTRERDRLLPAVRRMLDNTVLMLSSGRFSLDARELSGGVMRVRVRVEILEQTALAARDVDPNELNAIDYEPPQAGKPGHGAFLLNSGRRVICWVTPLG
jgi:hypothetical protein